jgi:antitoxin component of MazEF toxin-antitoxin module
MTEKDKKKGVWDFTKGVIDFTDFRNITTSGASFAITFPTKLAKQAGLNVGDKALVRLIIKPLEKMNKDDIKRLNDKNKH